MSSLADSTCGPGPPRPGEAGHSRNRHRRYHRHRRHPVPSRQPHRRAARWPGIALREINLGLRLLLELSAVAAFALWGYRAAASTVLSLLLAVTAPLVAATLWGTFVSPRAPRRLEDPVRLGVEVLFFLGAAGALSAAGWPLWGLGLAVLAAVHLVLMAALDQREL